MGLYYAIEFENDIKNKLYQKQVEIKQNSTSGDFSDKEGFHITVTYIGKDINNRKQYMDALDLYKEKYNPEPFELKLQNINSFNNGGEGEIVWIGVKDSLPLYEIKHNLTSLLHEINAPIEKDKHGGYTPHITMGYNVVLKEDFKRKFEDTTPIKVKSICLWDSFKANDTYITNKIYEVNF